MPTQVGFLSTVAGSNFEAVDEDHPFPVRGLAGSVASLIPRADGGLRIFRKIATNDTNSVLVGTGPQQLYGWYISNAAATARFVKFYDSPAAAAVGTTTPVLTVLIPANTNGAAAVVEFTNGLAFTNGIQFGITNLVADTDTTAPTAADVVVNLFWYAPSVFPL